VIGVVRSGKFENFSVERDTTFCTLTAYNKKKKEKMMTITSLDYMLGPAARL